MKPDDEPCPDVAAVIAEDSALRAPVLMRKPEPPRLSVSEVMALFFKLSEVEQEAFLTAVKNGAR